jgi:hypothetical protein
VTRLLMLTLFLSGCYAPMQVDAPVYLCWVTDKADVCVSSDKVKDAYDKLPPVKVKPW